MRVFSLLRSVLGHACILMSWLISDQVPPWNTYHHELLMVAGVFLLCPWRRPTAFPTTLFVFAGCWASAIVFQAIALDLSRQSVTTGLLFAGLFALAGQMGSQVAAQDSARTHGAVSLRSMCFTIIAGACLSAAIGFMQWTGGSAGLLAVSSGGRAFGNFGQPNHFATLLVMGLGALLFVDAKKFLPQWAVAVIAIVLCSALGISESRTGLLSIALLCVLVLLAGQSAQVRGAARWLLPGCVVAFVLYANLQPISEFFGATASRTGVGLNASGRFELWAEMIWAIRHSPWTGYGFLNLGAVHFPASLVFRSLQNVDYSHNIILDILIWFGLPLGGCLILFFCGWTIKTVLPGLGKKTSSEKLLCIAVILPIAVHSMLEYPHAYLYFSLIGAFFLGALEGLAEPLTRPVAMVAGMYRFANVGLLFVCLYISYEYSRIEADYRALRLENQFITDAAQRHIYTASPVLLTDYGNLIASQRRDSRADDRAVSPELARDLAKRFPWLSTHVHYYVMLVQARRCQGAADQTRLLDVLFGPVGRAMAQEQLAKRASVMPCNL